MQYGILYSLIKDDRYTSYACEIVSLNCSQLDTVSSYNYLGVVIDDGLIFDTFLTEKYNKVNMRVHRGAIP